MSGGSFDYLYAKLDNINLSEVIELTRAAADFLAERGKSEAAQKLRDTADQLDAISVPKEVIEIAYAAEWWASNDMTEQSFDQHVANFATSQ